MIVALALALQVAWGWMMAYPYLWLPLASLCGQVLFLPLQSWVESDRLGASVGASVLLKFTLSLIGLLAMVGFWASAALAAYWIIAL